MRINSVRSALAYQFSQGPAVNRQAARQPAVSRPQPAQDNGIIIVGGKQDNRVSTQNGILFVGGLSVIR